MKAPLVKQSTSIDPQIISLLEKTCWGTNEVRYYTKNIGDSLDPAGLASCLSLTRGAAPVACCFVSPKKVHIGNEIIHACFVSHFAVPPQELGKGYPERLAAEALRFTSDVTDGPSIDYTFVEAKNSRSLQLCNFFKPLCSHTFQVLTYNQFFPKEDGRVERLKPAEKDQMVRLLNEAYADHIFKDFELSVLPEHSYVIRDHDEIVAGLQSSFHNWIIASLAGLSGWVAIKLVPHVPLLRAVFNPANCCFLRFGNLYAKAGHEPDLCSLMNTLLARKGLKLAMIFMDKRSSMSPRIRAQGLGFLNRYFESEVSVLIRYNGDDNDVIKLLENQPIHISMIDQ